MNSNIIELILCAFSYEPPEIAGMRLGFPVITKTTFNSL